MYQLWFWIRFCANKFLRAEVCMPLTCIWCFFFKDTYTYQLFSAQYASLFSNAKGDETQFLLLKHLVREYPGASKKKKDTKNGWILSLQTRKTKVLSIIPYVCLIKTFKCYVFFVYVIYWDAKCPPDWLDVAQKRDLPMSDAPRRMDVKYHHLLARRFANPKPSPGF